MKTAVLGRPLKWLSLGQLLLAVCTSAKAQDWKPAQSGAFGAMPRNASRPSRANIRDPEPDSANFPNSAHTLAKGRLYIENSPVGFLAGAKPFPNEYQWQFLIRYGVTDQIEFRVFSNGLTARGSPNSTTGFSPLAFDVKMHLWDNKKKCFIPAVGAEMYIQTDLGSQAFDSGINPSVNILFDHTLPGGIEFEYNLGTARDQTLFGHTYNFSFPWSFSRKLVEDFNLFVHGFHGSSTLPRFQSVQSGVLPRPSVNAVGAGVLWTVYSRVAAWGSYNFGTTEHSPNTLLLGFAVAF
jgi:hypothetical protein